MSNGTDTYFDQYWKHNSVLRNWFVAYGIGALALVIYENGSFFENHLDQKSLFVNSIVIGISLQIILTFINKIIHWYVHYGKVQTDFQTTIRYSFSEWLTQQFIIDIIIDALTMWFYARALFVFLEVYKG